MNIDAITSFFDRLNFRQAVWFFVAAFALHVFEEAPQFTAWVNAHASKAYTWNDFVRINGIGLITGIAATALVSFFQKRPVIFLYYSLVLAQSAFCNPLFHIGSTAAFGVYSPGLLTSLTVYPFVFVYLSRLAFREGLLTTKSGLIAMGIAIVMHAFVVADTVFRVFPQKLI